MNLKFNSISFWEEFKYLAHVEACKGICHESVLKSVNVIELNLSVFGLLLLSAFFEHLFWSQHILNADNKFSFQFNLVWGEIPSAKIFPPILKVELVNESSTNVPTQKKLLLLLRNSHLFAPSEQRGCLRMTPKLVPQIFLIMLMALTIVFSSVHLAFRGHSTVVWIDTVDAMFSPSLKTFFVTEGL